MVFNSGDNEGFFQERDLKVSQRDRTRAALAEPTQVILPAFFADPLQDRLISEVAEDRSLRELVYLSMRLKAQRRA